MTSAEVRQRFLNFFAERDHKVLPSSSLVPFGDPTLLFTSAGMVQFKPYFLGQAKPPYLRATTCQKVFRSSDIDVVGKDGHHLTFFEMLGNFSFGNYFKENAIPYAYEFLVKDLRLDESRLWAGIHTDDDESFTIWITKTGIPAERIRRFGDEYNFWAAGPTGPCGPDSEIHYDWGEEYGCGRPDCGPNCEHCDRFLEIWNLVFMQWNRDETGKRTPLQRKGIDTGMGLERISSVLRSKRSVFETDLLRPIIAHFERLTGKRFGGGEDADVAFRVLADHVRGSTFLVADGVLPSNEGRGYVLRRLIRRAMFWGMRLQAESAVSSAVPTVSQIYSAVYPEVRKIEAITDTIAAEEARFASALEQGYERLKRLWDAGRLVPEDVFYLYDTLGFPVDLTIELSREKGFDIRREDVDKLMESQRQRSRDAASAFAAPLASSSTQFLGYDQLEAEATITEVFPVVGERDTYDVYLDRTPFYAERGGQAADHGWIETDAAKRATVLDVQWVGEAIRHRVSASDAGWLASGQRIKARVDPARRAGLAQHHSATHLLHQAIRDVLGEQATQAGSSVLPDYATLDFRFPRTLQAGELDRVRRLLNEKIRANLPRRVEMLALAEAVATGAVALFDEKYGDTVRVVSFGNWSRELCGGTHVERTGELGMALLAGDRSIGAGVRRIEMRAGRAAEDQVRLYEEVLASLQEALKGTLADLPGKVEGLQSEIKRLDKEVGGLKQRLAGGVGSHRAQVADVDGVRIGISFVDDQERDLLLYADHALNRPEGPNVAFVVGGRKLAVKVAREFSDRLEAGALIKAFTSVAGGKGGGKGQVGEGGGIDPSRVDAAFQAILEVVRKQLGNRP